jgi:hypothetical protein
MVGLDSFFERKETNREQHQVITQKMEQDKEYLKTKVQLVDVRLHQQILYDKVQREQGLLREYEHEYGTDCADAPPDKKAKCDEAKMEMERARKKIDEIPGEVEKMY